MEKQRSCIECGSPIYKKKNIYCGTVCRNRGITKNRRPQHSSSNPNWKGGRKLDSQGYVLVKYEGATRSDGYILEHILVMQQHLGRVLQGDEQVHHKDWNKENNSIENLELLTKSEHMRLHALDKIKTGIIRRDEKSGKFIKHD